MAGDERPDFYDLIDRNRRWTWVLLFAFFLLLVLVGASVSLALGGGVIAFALSVVIAASLAFTSYRSSATLALRSTRAVPAPREQYGRLNNVIEEVSLAAGIPVPAVYVVHDPAPNAFATGKDPDHAAVAVTTGLLDKMNRAELEGVIAHELAHIRNYDIRVMTVAVATAGSIAMVSDIFWRLLYFGALTGGGASHRQRRSDGKGGGGANPIVLIGFVFVVVLAPIAAGLLKAAISRRREALADASAVEFTRYPSGLRQALEKLDADITVVRKTSHATSHLWIESPDTHEKGSRGRSFNNLFNTHPPLSERIDLLREMEGLPPYQGPDPAIAEGLRTMQDNRRIAAPATTGAATATAAIGFEPAASSIDLDSVFRGAGEVAEDAGIGAAGWYADPGGEAGVLRYWDGHEWTSHVHRIPDQNRTVPPGARPARPRTRGRRRRII